jgi:hypothetical protein
VTRDVPPYAVVVGVPARVLRKRFDAETVERLQRIAWWLWRPEQIDAALSDFRELDAVAFAKKYDRQASAGAPGRYIDRVIRKR